MTTSKVTSQYSTGLSRSGIEAALIAAGKDLGRLRPEDLGPLGGRLAHWDIVSGAPGDLGYPLPWADRPDTSQLASAGQLRAAIESAGFAIEHWNDLTEPAAALMRAFISRPAEPLGLQAFVPDFAAKSANLTRGLASGHLRAIQGVAFAKELAA
jgi:sarcosine/dimethylglycine N-methyltransferase